MSLSSQIKDLYGGVAALGIRVKRTGLATDLTALANVNLFQITGGDILVVQLYGKVTTVIGAANTTLRIQATPTGGAITPMSAASAAINADAVDTIYSITGAIAAAVAISAGLGVGVGQLTNFLIVVPGVIQLTVGAFVTTGVIDWTLSYIPLDEACQVAAV